MSNTDWNKSKIDHVVQGFLDGSLPETQWTHEAHLVICAYHLMHHDYYDAILRIKLSIIAYNEAIGLKNTIDRGYHETLTLFPYGMASAIVWVKYPVLIFFVSRQNLK